VKQRSLRRRKAADLALKVTATISSLIGIFFLVWILIVVVHRGAAAINWTFFTHLPAPPGVSGGGLGNAILGTLMMTVLAAAIGVPVGVMGGVYLSEYGRRGRFAASVRFLINVMMGIPSIIMGLFIYALLVVPMGRFSGYAGGAALALLILPIVARTTEDMLVLVPNALRESALALGTPRWRVTVEILFRAAKTGLITGVLLAVARVSGETAPLLFTSLNSPYWPTSLAQPTGNLTVTIFNYAMSPYPDWQRDAWGASLLIMIGVLATTILARFAVRERRT
jgi:phosphate transport system permease protein